MNPDSEAIHPFNVCGGYTYIIVIMSIIRIIRIILIAIIDTMQIMC